jgi:hypothetical protein
MPCVGGESPLDHISLERLPPGLGFHPRPSTVDNSQGRLTLQAQNVAMLPLLTVVEVTSSVQNFPVDQFDLTDFFLCLNRNESLPVSSISQW